ncbi:molybdopterin-dependent oxidoreductase [Nocardioides ginsengisegetis]
MKVVKTSRGAWAVAGVVAGLTGLATSYFVAMVMTIRSSPVVAIAELVIRMTPGRWAEKAISIVGHKDKPILVGVILVASVLLFAVAGRLAASAWWKSTLLFAALAGVATWAVASEHNPSGVDFLPVVVGFVTWLVSLALLSQSLVRRQVPVTGEAREALTSGSRRGFLIGAGAMAALAIALSGVGRVVGAGRRHVEQTRRLLRLSGVSQPTVPAAARLDLPGLHPWMTPSDDFYKIHTAIVVPAIEPVDWKLRIHGLVDREVEITYQDLLDRRLTEGWITLNCVSNPVGGDLIGNAWWSGVRLAELLAEAGLHPDADAVLQTSDDGWTCGTPVSALTDDRNAMLAVAMNGKPLPIDHGFPVRTIVPGLYGYVSACKWVVDMEVTRFSEISAYWTQRGWGEQGPVKISSRIDVPRFGDKVDPGDVRVGGVAWSQHTGISAVEVALDGGDWQPAEISHPPTDDAWVQWVATVSADPGDHTLKVRATDKNGLVQTGAVADVLPDGATGWHTIGFTAKG